MRSIFNPSNEEIREAANRAKTFYDDRIKDQLTDADRNRYIAIDGNSGEWEIDDTDECVGRLRARVPDAMIHVLRHITLACEYIGAAPKELSKELYETSYSNNLADEPDEFGR